VFLFEWKKRRCEKTLFGDPTNNELPRGLHLSCTSVNISAFIQKEESRKSDE
jgi:hypothetical protein